MPVVYLEGRKHHIPDSSLIGKGGEANVYHVDPRTVLKLYKEPNDPDYFANPAAQQGAVDRIREQQRKLLQFPKGLPEGVVSPAEVAYSAPSGGHIMGYTMEYLASMEVLLRYGDRLYREQGGIDGNGVIATFRSLHRLVEQLHAAGIVIGDFNDLNVLVDGKSQAHLVDADSMQFGSFMCRAFTSRFVDPLNCEPGKLILARPHNNASDWYAYLIMLCQSLLYVGPYGGVHRPASGKRLQHDARVLQRLTVFGDDVTYPKPALPLNTLPDDLLGYMQEVFEADRRGAFPVDLLESLRWTTCTNCGTLHARAACPACQTAGLVKEVTVIHGKVTATRVFRTSGRIVHAAHQSGKLQYLYHESGHFRREAGQLAVPGMLDPELRYRIQGNTTLLGRRNTLLVFSPGTDAQRLSTDTSQGFSVFDANERHRYWIDGRQLVHDNPIGTAFIGDVLNGQTLFWVGRHFGFGFYQAGRLLRSFVFDAENRGLNDQVPIPNLPGHLIDATCVFGDGLAWFMASTQTGGRMVNRCYVVNQRGQVVAEQSADATDNTWLASSIRGHLAIGETLFAATDEGIIEVEADGGLVNVKRSFPDTESFVDATTQLLPSPEGIYAVSLREIVLLQIR